MARAYISDVVNDGEGKPVVGAPVVLLRANDFGVLPVSDPGSSLYVRQTVTAAGGSFVFDHVVPDDYHVMVQFGGQTVFKYFVTALSAEIALKAEDRGRGLIPRTLTRILNGESVTIAAVGDQISLGYNSTGTVAGSWLHRLGSAIGLQLAPTGTVNRYDPNSYGSLSDGHITGYTGPVQIQAPAGGSNQVVKIVNCSVLNDTVQRVFRRLSADLINGPFAPIDLYLISLGLNDANSTSGQLFVDPNAFAAGIRSLVDAVTTGCWPAEVALLTPGPSPQPDAGNGGSVPSGEYALEQYRQAIRLVALQQGCALVDIGQLWADRYDPTDPNLAGNDGYGSWLNNTGGNHTLPTDAGHQAIADEVFRLFGPPGAQPGRAMRTAPTAQVPVFKKVEVYRLSATNPTIAYSGGHWSTYIPATLGALYVSSGLQRSHTAGDAISITDDFQDLAILTRRGRDCGQILVSIDDGPTTTVDLYRGLPSDISDTTADGSVYPLDRVWLARGLSDGTHTAIVTVLGTHDASATDSYVYIDGVEYTRPTNAARKIETPNDANAKFQYGAFSINLVAIPAGYETIMFPTPFRNNASPVVVGSTTDNQWYVSVQNVTPTTADIHVVHRDGSNYSGTITGSWMAIG